MELTEESEAMTDYSIGRYVAYGAGSDARRVAYLEDGAVRSDTGTWLFRIEGNQIYAAHPKGSLQGFIDDEGVGRSRNGQFLFQLKAA
ncbi:hypothetical protein ACPA5B_11540 [Pseudomonas solani]|uniref:hypothetical protein n=1 Tax=Pseudomonas solani TaxID=2731552 RepID=UPI003C2BE3C2